VKFAGTLQNNDCKDHYFRITTLFATELLIPYSYDKILLLFVFLQQSLKIFIMSSLSQRVIAITLSLCSFTSVASATERRCGWYMNPTPGNLLLADKEATWWITSQMQANGPDAEGVTNNAPNFDSKQYVQTQNNGYGYGCACLIVETKKSEHRITKVISGETLPLRQCRNDKSLPKPNR
jgi:hypothetical protein